VRVAAAGRSVALIESRLVGGECPYWGCVPSKALLIAASRRRHAGSAHELGAVGEALDLGDPGSAWRQALRMRDERAKHLDGSDTAQGLRDEGVEVIRGEGRILGPGLVAVGDTELAYENLLISVGADAVLPPIPGLAEAKPWTSDDALTSHELPRRAPDCSLRHPVAAVSEGGHGAGPDDGPARQPGRAWRSRPAFRVPRDHRLGRSASLPLLHKAHRPRGVLDTGAEYLVGSAGAITGVPDACETDDDR
jgi:hypothetical protein